MTTSPGFSSRVTTEVVKQLPQRDEVVMPDEPGFSNSTPVDEDASKASVKVVDTDDDGVEDKAVKTAQSKRRKPAKG